MGSASLDGGGRRDREFKEFSEFREFSECAADNYLQGILPNFPKFPKFPKLPNLPNCHIQKKDGQGCPAVILFLCSLKALHVLIARRVTDILDKALDVLLLAAWAYHQHIVGVYNDIVLQAADDSHLIFGCEYHRVAGIIGLY